MLAFLHRLVLKRDLVIVGLSCTEENRKDNCGYRERLLFKLILLFIKEPLLMLSIHSLRDGDPGGGLIP